MFVLLLLELRFFITYLACTLAKLHVGAIAAHLRRPMLENLLGCRTCVLLSGQASLSSLSSSLYALYLLFGFRSKLVSFLFNTFMLSDLFGILQLLIVDSSVKNSIRIALTKKRIHSKPNNNTDTVIVREHPASRLWVRTKEMK